MTPQGQLKALFSVRPFANKLRESCHRFVATAEPNARLAPFFMLIRGTSDVAWGVRDDIPAEIADQLDRLASAEPPVSDFEAPPIHADEYLSLVGGTVSSGPAFGFPDQIVQPTDVTLIDRLDLLERHFRGWTADEIPFRTPIMAVMDNGYPVSVCFCATWNTEPVIEAGVETATDFRRRGYAARVTAAWACAIRASGRIPLYSTNWTNTGSRGVARKLGLIQYATDWSLVPKT
jgi:hypothetical protein